LHGRSVTSIRNRLSSSPALYFLIKVGTVCIVKLGMRPDRADVISHAGFIYLNCLKWSGAKKMVVPQVGLPDGIITQLYKEYKTQLA